MPLQSVESGGDRIHIMDEAEAVGTEVLQQLLPIEIRVRFHGAVMLRRGSRGIFHAPEHAGLGGLFLQRHPGQQIRHTVRYRKIGILIIQHG